MSLTPHPREERPHGSKSKKVPAHSTTESVPLMQSIAHAWFASWPKPTQTEWLSLVKENKEEELLQAQYMVKEDTLTTTTTTSTVYGPNPRMDGSYIVERVVQSESARQQIVYLASGEGS